MDYRAPETNIDQEQSSDDETEEHDPLDQVAGQAQADRRRNEQTRNAQTKNAQETQNMANKTHEHNEHNQTQQLKQNQNELTQINEMPNHGKWYAAKRLLKLRKKGGKREFLVEWADAKYKPSWQVEDNVGDFLKREFYITHNKQGKRRKRALRLKYFDKQ